LKTKNKAILYEYSNFYCEMHLMSSIYAVMDKVFNLRFLMSEILLVSFFILPIGHDMTHT